MTDEEDSTLCYMDYNAREYGAITILHTQYIKISQCFLHFVDHIQQIVWIYV